MTKCSVLKFSCHPVIKISNLYSLRIRVVSKFPWKGFFEFCDIFDLRVSKIYQFRNSSVKNKLALLKRINRAVLSFENLYSGRIKINKKIAQAEHVKM